MLSVVNVVLVGVVSVVAVLMLEGLLTPSRGEQPLPSGRYPWEQVVAYTRLFRARPQMLKPQHAGADVIAPQRFPQDLDGTLAQSQYSTQRCCLQQGYRKGIVTQRTQGSLQA
jgi:hypothetical protein